MSLLEPVPTRDGTSRFEPVPNADSPGTPATNVRGQLVDWAWLKSRASDWDALLAEAGHPTLAFGRGILEVHQHLGDATIERFAVVEADGRLAALVPLRPARFSLRRIQRVWSSAHLINATPLIARWATDPVLDALLDVLAEAAASTRGLVNLPLVSVDEPAVRSLLDLAEARGWGVRTFDRFERARFLRRPYDEYLQRHMTRRAHQSLVRRQRALRERGELSFGRAESGPELAWAVDGFLALEVGGWKGRRGTALACCARGRVLAERFFAAARDGLSPRAHWLALDGRPLAVSLSLSCHGTTSLVKIAYDEAYARFAPGVLLEHEIIRSCCEDGSEERLDSNSLAGGLLQRLYPDREVIAEILMATDPRVGAIALDRLVSRELYSRRLAKRVKDIYWRLVDWATALSPPRTVLAMPLRPARPWASDRAVG